MDLFTHWFKTPSAVKIHTQDGEAWKEKLTENVTILFEILCKHILIQILGYFPQAMLPFNGMLEFVQQFMGIGAMILTFRGF